MAAGATYREHAVTTTDPEIARSPTTVRSPTSTASEPQSVHELLRILDVASALRREREKATAELELPDTKTRLRERLRAAAIESGDPVTELEIDTAIDRYYATRHAFREPSASWRTVAAHAWVRRSAIAFTAGAAIVAIALTFFLFLADDAPLSPSRRLREQVDAAWSTATAARDAIDAIVQEPSARDAATRLAGEADSHRAARDVGRLAATGKRLIDLRDRLREEYEVRVVSRPGERSGIDAYYEDDEGKRLSGYYLIVEAIAPDGRTLQRSIRDAELDQERTVTKWGEQVPKAVYDRVAADKRADGIVDDALFARKRRGFVDEDVVMSGADGANPVTRGRRITTDL